MDLENLRIVRNEKGLSYQDMASKLGVSFQSYWMIENGKRGLSYETAIKIAEALGTTPDEIFLSKKLTNG